MGERQANQIIVLNMSSQSFGQRLRLRLVGYELIELSHVEDLLNWLSACEKNGVAVGCIVVMGCRADPLFKILLKKNVSIIFVDLTKQDRQELKKQTDPDRQAIIEFCSSEQLIDHIDRCVAASLERGAHG
ncbi:MAG: hypothetical protein J7K75_09585 [Desulfuromonas sp.]|nr:hypothetical protein [Desulfuromonas sp.]